MNVAIAAAAAAAGNDVDFFITVDATGTDSVAETFCSYWNYVAPLVVTTTTTTTR